MHKEIFIEFAQKYYKDMEHPLAVANKFPELSDEWLIGLFHDILEDTSVTDDELFLFLSRFNKYQVYLGVKTITRRASETYFEYINRIKHENGIAMAVKIADLLHNLSRKETLTPSLSARYNKALELLGLSNVIAKQ